LKDLLTRYCATGREFKSNRTKKTFRIIDQFYRKGKKYLVTENNNEKVEVLALDLQALLDSGGVELK